MRFARTQRLPFAVGRVDPQFVSQLRLFAYPTVFVLDAEGRTVKRQQGTLDVQNLQDTLAGLRPMRAR
ncbi:MAG: hypothetical protein AB1511_11690 [Deinococcota bacterium]